MVETSSRKVSRVPVTDSYDDIYAYVCEQRWGDGLPVVPPTAERVAGMVEASGRPASEVIARIAPSYNEATVEVVAVNAVMAGCLPEYMPVVVAGLQAMAEPEYNLEAIQTTTTPATPLAIINGPIRNKLKVQCQQGCLGPGWRANATIGRALRLAVMNVGEALPAAGSRAHYGWPGKYTFCFGEDEESSAWTPLHVDRGFRKEQSTITMAAVMDIRFEICSFDDNDPRHWMAKMAAPFRDPGTLHMLWREGDGVVVFAPAYIKVFTREGFTKAQVRQFIYEQARLPVKAFFDLYGSEYPHHGGIKNGMLHAFKRPEDILMVIAGGPYTGMVPIMPTWHSTKSVTKEIVSPS